MGVRGILKSLVAPQPGYDPVERALRAVARARQSVVEAITASGEGIETAVELHPEWQEGVQGRLGLGKKDVVGSAGESSDKTGEGLH